MLFRSRAVPAHCCQDESELGLVSGVNGRASELQHHSVLSAWSDVLVLIVVRQTSELTVEDQLNATLFVFKRLRAVLAAHEVAVVIEVVGKGQLAVGDGNGNAALSYGATDEDHVGNLSGIDRRDEANSGALSLAYEVKFQIHGFVDLEVNLSTLDLDARVGEGLHGMRRGNIGTAHLRGERDAVEGSHGGSEVKDGGVSANVRLCASLLAQESLENVG